MNLNNSERSKELGMRISQFMDEHIFPAEPIYAEQMEEFTKQGIGGRFLKSLKIKRRLLRKKVCGTYFFLKILWVRV